MRAQTSHDFDTRAAPPLDPEVLAVFRARGVKVKTGEFDPTSLPVRKRPAWLALLLLFFRRAE